MLYLLVFMGILAVLALLASFFKLFRVTAALCMVLFNLSGFLAYAYLGIGQYIGFPEMTAISYPFGLLFLLMTVVAFAATLTFFRASWSQNKYEKGLR